MVIAVVVAGYSAEAFRPPFLVLKAHLAFFQLAWVGRASLLLMIPFARKAFELV